MSLLPVTYIILNNSAYHVLKMSAVQYYGKEKMQDRPFIGMDLHPPKLRFDQLAGSIGVKGWRVN